MNVQKIIESLERQPDELWGRWYLFDGVKYCAVGWLLHERGLPDREINRTSNMLAEELIGIPIGRRFTLANDMSPSHQEALNRIREVLNDEAV